ncbi:Uncharacterised protein [Serratia fonticola]|uniref:Lipoprotein n=1 Tax=Serratia fonticola TaxID=47917 RepID=A0A4U9USU7_SERFO|nr:Uncharacterised protein [Serratia fonticola]
MSLKQWGVGLLCCSTLLLTACRVVDLDESGNPVIPPDPNAKVSFRQPDARADSATNLER